MQSFIWCIDTEQRTSDLSITSKVARDRGVACSGGRGLLGTESAQQFCHPLLCLITLFLPPFFFSPSLPFSFPPYCCCNSRNICALSFSLTSSELAARSGRRVGDAWRTHCTICILSFQRSSFFFKFFSPYVCLSPYLLGFLFLLACVCVAVNFKHDRSSTISPGALH